MYDNKSQRRALSEVDGLACFNRPEMLVLRRQDAILLHPYTAVATLPNLGNDPILMLNFELSLVDLENCLSIADGGNALSRFSGLE